MYVVYLADAFLNWKVDPANAIGGAKSELEAWSSFTRVGCFFLRLGTPLSDKLSGLKPPSQQPCKLNGRVANTRRPCCCPAKVRKPRCRIGDRPRECAQATLTPLQVLAQAKSSPHQCAQAKLLALPSEQCLKIEMEVRVFATQFDQSVTCTCHVYTPTRAGTRVKSRRASPEWTPLLCAGEVDVLFVTRRPC